MSGNLKKARVLSPIKVNEVDFVPNNVIEADPALIKSLGDSVDASSSAVKYCMEELGVEPVNISGEEEPDNTGNQGNQGSVTGGGE